MLYIGYATPYSYTPTYRHAPTDTHRHTYAHTQTPLHIHTPTHLQTYTHIHLRTHTHLQAHTPARQMAPAGVVEASKGAWRWRWRKEVARLLLQLAGMYRTCSCAAFAALILPPKECLRGLLCVGDCRQAGRQADTQTHRHTGSQVLCECEGINPSRFACTQNPQTSAGE